MRLDKFLCHCGVGTRSEVKKIIKAGKVAINGNIVKSYDAGVMENSDKVFLDGRLVIYKEHRYFLLNKPAGTVTALRDDRYPTVMSCLGSENLRDLAPVGRLDLDTEGLLIITDDGELAHHLISPTHHVEKCYFAKLDKPCPDEAVRAFIEGVDIGDDKLTMPAKLEILEGGFSAKLTLTEGRYHQVKRMFGAVGCKVEYLRRERIGSLKLGDLEAGKYRELTPKEVEQLYD